MRCYRERAYDFPSLIFVQAAAKKLWRIGVVSCPRSCSMETPAAECKWVQEFYVRVLSNMFDVLSDVPVRRNLQKVTHLASLCSKQVR
jgi:hypothetical protein